MLFLTQSGRHHVGPAPGAQKANAGGAARHRAPWPAIAPSARPAGLAAEAEMVPGVPGRLPEKSRHASLSPPQHAIASAAQTPPVQRGVGRDLPLAPAGPPSSPGTARSPLLLSLLSQARPAPPLEIVFMSHPSVTAPWFALRASESCACKPPCIAASCCAWLDTHLRTPLRPRPAPSAQSRSLVLHRTAATSPCCRLARAPTANPRQHHPIA